MCGQKSHVPHTLLCTFFCDSIFSSWFEVLIILQQATRKARPRAYQCIWDNYVILAQIFCQNNPLCQCGLFMHTCVSKDAFVSKDVIFYLLRYNKIYSSSHIYKKYSFLSFQSLLFSVNNTGRVTDLNWQCETLVNRMKNAIMQVTYFLHGFMIDLLFICHITLYQEKMTSYEKFNHSLTLEVQIVWKIWAFKCCKWKYGNADK